MNLLQGVTTAVDLLKEIKRALVNADIIQEPLASNDFAANFACECGSTDFKSAYSVKRPILLKFRKTIKRCQHCQAVYEFRTYRHKCIKPSPLN